MYWQARGDGCSGLPKLSALVMTPKLGNRSGVQSKAIRFGYGEPLQARACAPHGPAQGPEAYSVGCIFGDRPWIKSSIRPPTSLLDIRNLNQFPYARAPLIHYHSIRSLCILISTHFSLMHLSLIMNPTLTFWRVTQVGNPQQQPSSILFKSIGGSQPTAGWHGKCLHYSADSKERPITRTVRGCPGSGYPTVKYPLRSCPTVN